MSHNNDDVKNWFAEWRIWGATSIIIVLAWVAWGLFRGRFDTFWPLGVIAVWAAVLLSAPLWPSSRKHDDQSPAPSDGSAEDHRDA